MSRTIDINCDLGEGFPNDAELMRYISSVNIACGFHAGDEDTMRRTVELAIENDVAIGAHPSYLDRENFGRTRMSLSPDQVFDIVCKQIQSLKNICDRGGTSLHHVKPHGALYNEAAKDIDLAAAIADAVNKIDAGLILYGLSGSYLISEAEAAGLRTASEVFADRTYENDGTLTPRSRADALISQAEVSVAQVLQMVERQSVTSISGEIVPLIAETICIHGDGGHAMSFASRIRTALQDRGFEIRAS
jgi:5-oxoprolinase (ATP-hydrolysing) subunit A